MCEKGYHNVNTVDIAKYADVSTGIIYQYFSDKRDIFIEGTKNYCHEVVYHKHDSIDYSVMKKVIINTIKDLLS